MVAGVSNKTIAEVMGGFIGKGMAMEGLAKVQIHVLFYILRMGGNILNSQNCENFGLVSQSFRSIGAH